MHKRILTVAASCCISAVCFASQNSLVKSSSETQKTPIPKHEHHHKHHQNDFLKIRIHQIYVGAFGGGGSTYAGNFSQQGVAMYPWASNAGHTGGPDVPVIVNAQGTPATDSAGMVGMQAGYQWLPKTIGKAGSPWSIIPAAEFEGYYLRNVVTTGLNNPTIIAGIDEHLFEDTFPLNTGVFLGNAVFTLNSSQVPKFHPYVAGGIGAAVISISGATSTQVAPTEPGINHFNTNPDASNWTFAAQGKAGVQFDVNTHWKIFGEYRYLYLASTYYTFGATAYPAPQATTPYHIPTTSWIVNFSSIGSNLGVGGIKYLF